MLAVEEDSKKAGNELVDLLLGHNDGFLKLVSIIAAPTSHEGEAADEELDDSENGNGVEIPGAVTEDEEDEAVLLEVDEIDLESVQAEEEAMDLID